ncbi:KAT8 regulatory NSL complex subunit 3 isoform X1 [Cataglyphis hispanica]|uniref:KAT8 regulatory NSL complex subunit 3 isoform X1 n=1 Tax=Cataglyphis hispanica TaxID=1086592 RepID=UPI00217F66A0|nr:KAT8 regulatory NSL complex subunit 3 isoform X1 [Cataglyphis hispanica]XP_050448838.1 KAT8 regulatory NSL complex subunit 3 isoform X1 [Cataglyphis hispanica]
MLTPVSMAPSTSVGSSGLPSPTTDTFDDNSNRVTVYLHQLAGSYEMDVDVIFKDHCYARPWNWKPENIYVKPVKKLFFSKNTATNDKHKKDEEIDVEDIDSEPLIPLFDLTRTRHLMDEFQRLASFARPEKEEDWEENINKTLWSSVQNRIFSKVTRILSSERLARLAKAKSAIEPIFRRTSVDIATRRFREMLASTGWDWRLAQWLHNLLFEHLPHEYLAIYLDILQTLRVKIPQLIDKMIAVQPNINARGGSITWETLGSLLKRSWDPVAPSLNGSRPKKLPGNPILIIVPSGITSTVSSRQHKWITQLGSLGMVATVHTQMGLAANRMTMMVCIDQLVQATRAKIQDVKNDCPGRPIILVGFNTGAALACQIAQMEHVTAVICIGFPFSTVEGKRGTPDDMLMDIRCPVMFIIGQNATLVRPDDLEDLREKMLVETSLVVVGTADDYLRISTSKKVLEGITQNMVDRCILDEIGDFIGSILLQPHPLPLRSMMPVCENKNKKDSHKRRNSTSSSVESEPNSPTVKKSRPNTPVSSAPSAATNATTNSPSKIGTFNTQSNLVQMSGQQTNHASTLKRKRLTINQKNQLTEHLKTSKIPGQTNINAENGITLNIGTLASLAPIGPIRLAPTTVNQSVTSSKTSNTSKAVTATVKVPKIISNVPLQNVSKMKTIVSSNKSYSNVMSNNYRQVNVAEKSGDAKLVNVFTTGNQIRVNTAAGAGSKAACATTGTLSNLLQSGKSSIALTSGPSSARVSSASSILLTTTNSSASNITSSTTTPSKAMEEMGMSSESHLLEISKSTLLPRQEAASDNSHNTCGNIVIVENSLHNRSASSSVIVPFNTQNSGNILPLSNKLKLSHKSMKTMPKITVNANNLQRLQKGKVVHSIQKKNIVTNDIDDELGNILDIPIIFAKDDDNLSNIDKIPIVTQATPIKEPQERPKLSSTTKVVLISNKQDKQLPNKPVICPNMQNLNQLILQTRSQNNGLSMKNRLPIENRLVQPAVKYTKIILAKRSSQPTQQNERGEQQMIATTKIAENMNAPKILTFEKDEHRYIQAQPSKASINYDSLTNNVLEIEDAIKTNIIERKYVSTIDTMSPVTLDDDDCDILNDTKLEHEKEYNSEQSIFDNVNEIQT